MARDPSTLIRALPDQHSLSASGGRGPGRGGSPSLNSQLTTTSLGHRLRRLGICSHNIRLGGVRAKGYDLSDFTKAFSRFL